AVTLDQLEPLTNRYGLGDLAIDGLEVDLERAADGGFPPLAAFTPGGGGRDKAAGGAKPAPVPTQREAVPPAAGNPLHWPLRSSGLREGRVRFADRTVSPAVQLDHRNIRIALAEIGNRQEKPAHGEFSLEQNESSRLSWVGELDIARARAGGRLEAS